MKIDATNRQRLLVIGSIIAIVLLLGDRMVLTPLTNAWRTRTAEIAKLQKQVTEGRGVIARAKNTQAKWKEMQEQALPKEPAQAEQDLITAFDRWGKASNAQLGSIRPQWKRGTNSRYSLLECRVDVSGSLATLTRFMYEVEKSPLALRVDSIELTSRDEFGQKLTLGLLVSGLRFAPLEGKQ
jgi:Tfp pilus assembly protein PilO